MSEKKPEKFFAAVTRRVTAAPDHGLRWGCECRPGTEISDSPFANQLSFVWGTDMFTQLSLFDLATTATENVHDTGEYVAAATRRQARIDETERLAACRLERECQRRQDDVRPLGDLARLVLARYDLLAKRRQQRERLRREQPRRSIRVLSPALV